MSKVDGLPTDLAFGDFNICTVLLHRKAQRMLNIL
jgi:hypothetical protein